MTESKEIEKIEAVRDRVMQRMEEDDRCNLKVKEMNFARLIVEEGWTQFEAYVESFVPRETAKKESIEQMACRIAKRPRVQAEMERIRQDIKEREFSKDQRMGIALDGNACRNRLALEFFAIGMSNVPVQYRLAALRELGRMKHVDAFVGASNVLDEQAKTGEAKNADQARANIVRYIRKNIAEAIPGATIDVGSTANELEIRSN